MKIISILLITTFFMIKGVQLIINGNPADLRDFPFIASLFQVKEGHLCGAAAIGRRYLLTAAHCVHEENPRHWVVRLGIVNLNDRSGEIFGVRKFHIRSDYKPSVIRKMTDKEKSDALACGEKLIDDEIMEEPPKNDLAIVETGRDFDYNLLALPLPRAQEFREDIETVGMAIIKLAKRRPEPCALCIVAGWGNSVEDSEKPTVTMNLMYMLIRVHSKRDCLSIECPPDPGVICAQHPAENAATSFGDSGGPLICDGRLAGVLSNGDYGIDGTSYYPDVTLYRDWINGIINDKPPSTSQNK